MDEAAPAAAAAVSAVREDGAEGNPPTGESEESLGPPPENKTDRVGVFCCRDCGEAFKEEAAYEEHRHQHLQESIHLDEQSEGSRDAENDMETALFCTLCSLSFVEPSDFHLHMEKKHGEDSQKESSIQLNSGTTNQPSYECQDCGKCYGVFGHFLNHQRSHTQASKSVFTDLEQLKKKSFQCESCGRSYSRASALDAHRRCHEEKLVKVKNRSPGDQFHTEDTTAEAKLSEKQTDDSPEKSFQCACGKTFTALTRLRTHQRFSRNSQCSREEMREKPKKAPAEYQCTECNKAFNSHIAIFNHQRWHTNSSKESGKRYPCEECGKVFMTLTFYYRHKRTAHSDETAAKSFLHQVCQLQKKAFECKDCGLKFSRASALHSHELHHTDNFKETEKKARTFLPLHFHTLGKERHDTDQAHMKTEYVIPTSIREEDEDVDSDGDMGSYDTGDFNVQVISASESEEEPTQDPNSDLELLCESDQERDDCDTEDFHSRVCSKPGMDLKIVQIDFEQHDTQSAPIAEAAQSATTGERYDCPDCYRWFTSPVSLRVHRMWHGIRKRRQQTPATACSLACKDCGLEFTDQMVFNNHLHQHALDEEQDGEADKGQIKNPNGNNTDVGGNGGRSNMMQTNPSDLRAPKVSMKRRSNSCKVCGKVYKYLSSLMKHKLLCKTQTAVRKPIQKVRKYECPDCGMEFIKQARLIRHQRIHSLEEFFQLDSLSCSQCNKTFNSEKSFLSHIDLHRERPFWCLSCSRGFFSEESLEKHLQGHNLNQHMCKICSKSFCLHTQLINHYNTHTGAKPFQCTICGKCFAHPGNLISHRKKHGKGYAGSSGVPFGVKKSAKFAKAQVIKRLSENTVDEEMESHMDTLPEKEDEMEESRTENSNEDAEFGDGTFCGDEEMNTEEKYWEWECCVCDTGFDEVASLHLHYIQHATGELPIPQDLEG